MKYLVFFFAFLSASSIYSATCGAGYNFTWTSSVNCVYTFSSVIPGHPSIDHITWTIASTGVNGTTCDVITSTPNLTYTFCFYGNYDVTMEIFFTGGGSCTVMHTVTATCSGAFECDLSHDDIQDFPCPLIEITYMGPYICATGQSSPVSGCMYTFSSTYSISCGWTWAIRVPPYICDGIWTYYVEYIDATTCGSYSSCTHLDLDTTVQCINAKIDEPIYIVVSGNHCCLPAGYQRGFIWTPNTGTLHPIGDPSTTLYGQCRGQRSCPGHSGNCVEDQEQCCETSGWPSPCFRGEKKLQQRDYIILGANANIEQNVIIYNIQGIVVFNGKWKFGDPGNLYLNWPGGVASGLYFVKFQNSEGKGITKLYKFN